MAAGDVNRRVQRATRFGLGGEARAAKLAQGVADKVTPQKAPGAADAASKEGLEPLEATILERLPLVCGRLLASYELKFEPLSGPGKFIA